MQTTSMRQRWFGRIFTGLLASGLCLIPTLAQADQVGDAAVASRAATPTATRKASPHRQAGQPDSANSYYQSLWGVDNFLVRSTASGNLIRFSYRVTDPARAKQLSDRSATPYMIGLRSRAVLQVPVMDKVGPLRQTTPPKPGQELWMVFSNKGNLVRSGDSVNVVIGSFHVDGLRVE
ncbi:MAG: hypothetical protein H6R26_2686 [Proteobacteria bacterium]|nr:hypothetical protein [Pseudomonadota bacterium]